MKLWSSILVMISCVMATASAVAGDFAPKSAIVLEISDGDTAFIVDPASKQAWWSVGECRREIPVKSQKNNNKSIVSEEIIENVMLGDRQVTLKQQFRFHLVGSPGAPSTPLAEVYNSLRGGWSPVPVVQTTNCALDAACRQRMEAPPC